MQRCYILKKKTKVKEAILTKQSKIILINKNNNSLLSMNKNLNKIQYLQRQIRKYLSSKNNQNKLFNRPPQTKSKNNYLYLNSNTDKINELEKNIQNNNINTNEIIIQEKITSHNDKDIETQDDIDKMKLNQEDDSLLNSEIKYVENK